MYALPAERILRNWSLGPELISSALNAALWSHKRRFRLLLLRAATSLQGQEKNQAASVTVAQVLPAAPVRVDVGTGKKLRLGTRKSALALVQSNWVKEEIETHWPEVNVDLVKFTTKGDKILDLSLIHI